ncbi:uncharacterized protein BKA78DRAFT_110600 [Phyllosticta capitalensis]|uniref:uncharacterized protein n=1 Tax=Phyllosticta capitalensis TaxID=121624 RepID=UPI003131B3D0
MTWTSRHLQMSLFLLTLPFTRIGCFGRTRDPSIPWTERRSFCGLCTNTPHRRGSSVMCLLGHARHTHEGAVPAGPGRLHPLCDNSTSPSRWSLSEPVTDWIGKRWKTSASACNGSGRMEEVGGSNSVISFHSFSHLAQSLFSILVRRVVTKIALFVSSNWFTDMAHHCRSLLPCSFLVCKSAERHQTVLQSNEQYHATRATHRIQRRAGSKRGTTSPASSPSQLQPLLRIVFHPLPPNMA